MKQPNKKQIKQIKQTTKKKLTKEEKKEEKQKQHLLELQKHLESVVCTPIHFVNMLERTKSKAIQHLPDKQSLIKTIWNKCADFLKSLLLNTNPKEKIEQIISTPEFQVESSWMTLNDKLISSETIDLNTTPMMLFVILLQELIIKEKDSKHFWTPAYKELSEMLLSPTEIDSVDLGLNSSECLLKKAGEKSSFLTMNEINLPNKNSQKTSYQLSTSTVVDKWENEAIKTNKLLKCLKIKLKPSLSQKKILNEWFHTTNYIYNKTLELINKGHKSYDWQGLRDILVTANTKKQNTKYEKIQKEIKRLENYKKELDCEYNDSKKNIQLLLREDDEEIEKKNRHITRGRPQR